jgi:hypothetical protein
MGYSILKRQRFIPVFIYPKNISAYKGYENSSVGTNRKKKLSQPRKGS